ncbi:MAG: hypothetical protein KUG52_00360 [Immundisolibacteraceae bacterium]|nr:hypothetical protein [Immundisolibacteraceae bacterium]
MNRILKNTLVTMTLCATLFAQPGFAASSTQQNPTSVQMGADLIIARPVQLAATLVGTVVFVASLPFTVMGDNVGQAAKALVADPAKATFARCLGCTH